MQTIMETGKPYGYLTDLDGQPMAVAELARIVGERAGVVQQMLDRLVAAGATDFDGTTYNDPGMLWKRSVKQARSDAGKLGAAVTNQRQGVAAFAATEQGLPQQLAGIPAEGAPSRQVLEGSSGSDITTSTATTSTTHAGVDAEERVRRLALIERNPKVQAIAVQFPSDGDRALFHAMLVQVSLKGGPGGARGLAWLAEITDMLNPERMHGQPVPMGVLAQSIRDFGGNGWLDDDADPKPAHFKAFVEYVRAGTKPPMRAGSKGWKPTTKQPGTLDTTGNASAAERLTRELDS